MALLPPSEESGLLPADFDLGQIFIGREHQLDLFHIYLERWKREMLTAPDTQMTAAPSPNNKLQGLVVLLYGRGGFGKSTLLKHYREIALQDRLVVSEPLDWEFAAEGKRSLFNPAPGREVDAPEYFRFLCSQLAGVLKKRPDEFREYQAAVKAVEEARKQAKNVLESVQKDDRYAGLRGVAAEELVKLVRQYVPFSSVVLSDEKLAGQITEGVSEGMKIGAEQIRHVYTRLHDKPGQKLDDYLEPALRLGLALGRDLSHFAKNFPMLMFFDTYEEVDEADQLLRLVMGAAGARVGWVLAGRDNLWAGFEQRKRSVGKVYGYKEIVSPGLGLAIDFNAGGVGAFTASDIIKYFSLLHQRMPSQRGLPVVTEEDAQHFLEVTQGVPLAVRIAAGLYLEKTNLVTITEKSDGKREIADEMVQRYLLHTHDDQHERMRLYGLAMLRRADHPAAIAAALGLSTEQARTSYETELSRLQRRYSFIFAEKAHPSLHQEVRYFLRLWLLEHRNQPEIMAVNESLKQAHETTLKELEDHRQYATLRERLEDEEWVGIYLDLAEQQFWLGPAEGVRYCLPFMLAAAIYRRNANQEVITIGNFFKNDLKQPYHKWWEWATHSLTSFSSHYVSSEELSELEELVKLVSQHCPTFPSPLPDYREELEPALWWRLGEAHFHGHNYKALIWYMKALPRLSQQAGMQESVAQVVYYVTGDLFQVKRYTECISLLNSVIELMPNHIRAYSLRGAAYGQLGEYHRALADFNRVIGQDPSDQETLIWRGQTYGNPGEYQLALADLNLAVEKHPISRDAYYQRGKLHGSLGEHEKALADFEEAINLSIKFDDDVHWGAWLSIGVVYLNLKDYQKALDLFDRAIELGFTETMTYYHRGAAYYHLKDYQKALADFDRAIDLSPMNADFYRHRGRTYVRLKDYQRAIDDYTHVIQLASNDATGLRSKVKDGLAELEQAISLDAEGWDAYFWKGMLCAYFYPGRNLAATEALGKALEMGLPPVLLTPLYWLEKDKPNFFKKYAAPLLARCEV